MGQFGALAAAQCGLVLGEATWGSLAAKQQQNQRANSRAEQSKTEQNESRTQNLILKNRQGAKFHTRAPFFGALLLAMGLGLQHPDPKSTSLPVGSKISTTCR